MQLFEHLRVNCNNQKKKGPKLLALREMAMLNFCHTRQKSDEKVTELTVQSTYNFTFPRGASRVITRGHGNTTHGQVWYHARVLLKGGIGNEEMGNGRFVYGAKSLYCRK